MYGDDFGGGGKWRRWLLKWKENSDTLHSSIRGKRCLKMLWNYNNVQNQYLNVAESLRDAMTKNTHLKVFIGSGYYDFATPYFTANYDVAHMFLKPELRKNVQHFYYEAGHMFYINKTSLVQFKKDVDSFFEWSNNVKVASLPSK